MSAPGPTEKHMVTVTRFISLSEIFLLILIIYGVKVSKSILNVAFPSEFLVLANYTDAMKILTHIIMLYLQNQKALLDLHHAVLLIIDAFREKCQNLCKNC